MTNFIPIIPYQSIIFPEEYVNMQLNAPQDKQLIMDCISDKKLLGVITKINGEEKEMGTLLEIVEVFKENDSNTVEVRLKGTKVFRMLHMIDQVPDKMYKGAVVHYQEENYNDICPHVMKELLFTLRQHFKATNKKLEFNKPDYLLKSYDLAKKLELSLADEYYLLELEKEVHRQEFIKRYLHNHILPKDITPSSEVKSINIGGVFKNLDGFSYS